MEEETLDETEIVFCKNGIIDLTTYQFSPKIIPHNKPMLNIEYIHEKDLKDYMKARVSDFVTKVLPNKETRKMVLEFLWLALTDRHLKIAQYHIGTGSNGKSTFFAAVNYLWGDYAYDVEKEIDINEIKGKRLICYNACSEIQVDKIKTMLSTPVIETRENYNDAKCLRNNPKIVIISNDLPQMALADMSMKQRMQMIPWVSFFYETNIADKNQAHGKYKYPIDPYFKTEAWFKSMAPYFFHFIMSYGQEIKNRMLKGFAPYPIPSPQSLKLHHGITNINNDDYYSVNDDAEEQKKNDDTQKIANNDESIIFKLFYDLLNEDKCLNDDDEDGNIE